jgi:hypothetical protein
MHHCLNCDGVLELTRLACPACGLAYEGGFRLPRLARLSAEQQDLVERVILAGGNLKDAARDLEISFPTLRKRLDAVVEALTRLGEADGESCRALLDEVERERRAPEEAARLIKELRGGL